MKRDVQPLIQAARGGDGFARNQLMRTTLPRVLAWSRRLSPKGVDPEDVAHDACVIIHTKLGVLREDAAYWGWVYGITRRVILAHKRRAWLRRWVPGAHEMIDYTPGTDDVEATVAERQTAALVHERLHLLPHKLREAVVLCDIEERTDADAAELLGVPIGTLKSRLRRGRQRLALALQDTREQEIGNAQRI